MSKHRALFGLLLATGMLTGCSIHLVDSPTTPDVTVVGTDADVSYIPAPPTYTYGHGTQNPVIQSFTANPTNHVPQGQAITFTVVAYDPAHGVLQYNWSCTGGTLSSNSGAVVSWTPPTKAGIYTVSVTIQNGANGGFVMGSQNLTVEGDGSTNVGNVPAGSSPAPAASASASPIPTPTPAASASASPSAAPSTSASPSATPSPAASVNPATDKGTILGAVKDTAGAAIANTTVVINSVDGNVPFNAQITAGADGSYRFDGVPAGVQMVVSARATGYKEGTQIVTATKDGATLADFSGKFALVKAQ